MNLKFPAQPLALPPPVIFSPRPVYSTLGGDHAVPLTPAPSPSPAPAQLLPTPPTSFDLWREIEEHLTNGNTGVEGNPTGLEGLDPTTILKRSSKIAGDSRPKGPQYDFVYADSDTFENEINEFYNYQDNPTIQEGRIQFHEGLVGKWSEISTNQQREHIEGLLESLEFSNPQERYDAARSLLYYSQGVFGECTSMAEHIDAIKRNNRTLAELGAMQIAYSALQVVSTTLDELTRLPQLGEPQSPLTDKQAALELANVETSIYLSLLYMMVEVHLEDEQFAGELADTNPPLAAYLFNLVAQLAEGNRKHYPVKKLLLLLWKVLLATVGATKRLKQMKNLTRLEEGLPESNEDDVYAKCTPLDYHYVHTLVTYRYPSYYTPDSTTLFPDSLSPLHLVDPITSPLAASLKRQLMVPAPANLHPFMSSNETMPVALRQTLEILQRNMYISHGTVQVARVRRWMEQSSAKDQQAQQRAQLDQQQFLEVGAAADLVTEDPLPELVSLNLNDMPHQSHRRPADLTRLESLYKILLSNMPTHIGMLVRLLYYVNLGNAASQGNLDGTGDRGQVQQNGYTPTKEELRNIPPELRQEYLDRIDLNRHKEVVTKAVSGILLSLLKAFKCHHVLEFEHISSLLVDNNCAILILKMLSTWFQNPGGPGATGNSGANVKGEGDSQAQGMASPWLKYRDEPEELNFFSFCRDEFPTDISNDEKAGAGEPPNDNLTPPTESLPELPSEDTQENASTQPPPVLPSCWRNFYISITLLRILHKLTKLKPQRLLSLVQWKASAVLKRVLKVNHSNGGLHLYALKLLKSQMPYLGKKWRANNMKVVTGIYVHLRPRIMGEWLAEAENNPDEAVTHEQQLRAMITYYHTRRYGSIWISIGSNDKNNGSTADDSAGQRQASPHSQGRANSAPENGSDGPDDRLPDPSDVHHSAEGLGENFMENYELWLHQEVFSDQTRHGLDLDMQDLAAEWALTGISGMGGAGDASDTASSVGDVEEWWDGRELAENGELI